MTISLVPILPTQKGKGSSKIGTKKCEKYKKVAVKGQTPPFCPFIRGESGNETV